MTPPATAAARSSARVAPRVAPRHPRRVSGPVRRPVAVPPITFPTPQIRVGGLALLDRLTHSRAWIWLIGVGLMGIVAMQVSLLKLNTGISRAVQTANTLELQNAQLESQIARLSSNERIAALAARRGMIAPPAGDVIYVNARPDTDPVKALRRMRPPTDTARGLMANGGRIAGLTAATAALTASEQTAASTGHATGASNGTHTSAPNSMDNAAPTAGSPTMAAAPTPSQG